MPVNFNSAGGAAPIPLEWGWLCFPGVCWQEGDSHTGARRVRTHGEPAKEARPYAGESGSHCLYCVEANNYLAVKITQDASSYMNRRLRKCCVCPSDPSNEQVRQLSGSCSCCPASPGTVEPGRGRKAIPKPRPSAWEIAVLAVLLFRPPSAGATATHSGDLQFCGSVTGT